MSVLRVCVKESCEMALLCGKCDEKALQELVANHPVLDIHRAVRVGVIARILRENKS